MSGISRPALNNIIKNKASPGFYTLEKIAKPLGKSVQDFLDSARIYDGKSRKYPKENYEYELELKANRIKNLSEEIKLKDKEIELLNKEIELLEKENELLQKKLDEPVI